MLCLLIVNIQQKQGVNKTKLSVSTFESKFLDKREKNNVKNVVFIEDLNFLDKIQQFGAFGSVVALLEVAEKRKVRNKSFDFY